MDWEALIDRAKLGDGLALEKVVQHIQDDVYGVSMRMLWHPQDAEDATQEILIRIVTHISTFKKDSSFRTWVYKIASNYLLTTRKRRAEKEEITFEKFAEQLDEGLKHTSERPKPEEEALIEEIKIGCTQGMLLCLDRDHRIAYILGEILELSSQEAAYILGISNAAVRKRLSRARKCIQDFMMMKCGIVNPKNRCRCAKRIPYAIRTRRLQQDHLLFAQHPVRANKQMAIKQIRKLEELRRSAALYRSHPQYAAPVSLLVKLRSMLGLS
ncbi:MAG TPA: RNA polymerase sigma factor [Acidobacteriota bacterium]|nr:RNA polymerase sigma factor [Acidobacteriota bacterium]